MVACGDVKNRTNSRIFIRMLSARTLLCAAFVRFKKGLLDSPKASILKKIKIQMCRIIRTFYPRCANLNAPQLATQQFAYSYSLPASGIRFRTGGSFSARTSPAFRICFYSAGTNDRKQASKQPPSKKTKKEKAVYMRRRVYYAAEQQRRKPRARTTAITGQRRH